MSNFYNTVIRNSKYFGSDAVCKDIAMLEPGTRAAVLALVAEAATEGHNLRVLETYRSQTRQSALFMKHATQLRVVGCHGYGVAADLGVFVNGKYQEDDKPYQFLDALARKHSLVSGLTWGHPGPNRGFVDSDHLQRIPVWRQNAMFNGSWYPPENYDPYADRLGSLLAAPVPQVVQPVTPTASVKGSVAWVQEKLNEWAPSFRLDIDGSAGSETKHAIRRFQQEHKLPATGAMDPQTLAALAAS